ncbi:hypothetical protein ABZV34_23750 [Streptomyces sp. NPDC005195]|uniref:hypothetical protein n=1 Tax=Streptomyces sp. NPDC005195 TaxID=3154561 RepID=UPI0033A04FF8
MTAALSDTATSTSTDLATHPSEILWTPAGKDAARHGFVIHNGLYTSGLSSPPDDDLYPQVFITLGHHRWSDAIEGASAYMNLVHEWRTLHIYPGDDPEETIPRIPRAVLAWGVFLRHLHDDERCACEQEGSWRMVWAPPTEPGAVPVTAIRHPAATAAAAGIPDPDQAEHETWAA